MNTNRYHTFLIAVWGVFLTTSAVGTESLLQEGGPIAAYVFAEDDASSERVYIVQLTEPAATSFFAAQRGAIAGKPGASFDKSNARVESYAQQLADSQQQVLAKAGPGARQIYSYRYALNGFAARMSPAQAGKLANLPEVANVWEDEVRPLTTNYSPQFLKLFDGDGGLRGAEGLDGDGIVIGFIDSGIAAAHPALRDTRDAPQPRLCTSTWGTSSLLGRWLCRRFRRQPDVILFESPEDWNGTCETGPDFAADSCNNKLIGARFYLEGAQNSGPIDSGEVFSPLDVDGHGTHTATTAAGNKVDASIYGTFMGRVEGMAPRARVAAYKACWLRPDATRSSCNTSDLALAIDDAVADGVDIINYSVGNSMRDTNAPDDLALLAAAKAGVLTIVAAGNDGPNLATIGSPAGSPWVITTGASSREGEHSLEALEVTQPTSLAGRFAIREANFSAPLDENGPLDAELILADDGDTALPGGASGTTFDACEALINDSEVSGKIAFIQRGGCNFDIKVANAEDAGAIAVVVFNVAGDPTVMTGTNSAAIPAVMIGQADGNRVLDELNAGEIVTLTLDKSFFLTVADTGNVMGSFSSRGPAPIQDILKPDVTAPGINILAGFTPDAVNSVTGEDFAFLTGTSMSTPHVAGVAALIKQAHPTWTPAAVKSALVTTAYQDVNQQDGTTPANAFDFGAGHIAPNEANDPGLIFDAGNDDYDAFSCAIDAPAVSQTRCDELENAGASMDTSDLNQPSVAVARLANSQTVTRRVTNVSDTTETYAAQVTAPPGILVDVTPPSISVPPGQSVSFEVTLTYDSGPLDAWRFGSLTWLSEDHAVRSPLAVRPTSLTAPAEVQGSGASGTLAFPVEFGYDGSYSAAVHGLRSPLVVRGQVDEDNDKTFVTADQGNGATAHIYSVPADQAYLRFALFDALTDGNDDLDMYVYYCPDNVNCSRIGESGEETSNEQFNVLLPGAGTYVVYVHGFDTDNVNGGPGAVYDILAWQFGLNDDQNNMTVVAPTTVSAGSTEQLTVDWTNLDTGTIYLGGISHTTPAGLVGITVVTIQN
ncbi:MAG: S8 family serine peptidase [Woeseia sp.]|nr:S8 family serine peptidase [Woeseia sp.]MBT8097906.1 S8 family serine peptidase [Woeseia sp.]NNE60760.1 S8 family serine peptidase [Woeseia sp.]NNL55392.1 S8 family serine peptidase [Woeseia sp.]